MQAVPRLEPGRPAPDFEAPVTSGETIRLSDYRGRRVILYFYPKDDTPGCTVEACGLRDHYDTIRELGAEVLGVSVDGAESHRRFTEKFNIPFPLVADADAKIAAIGVRIHHGVTIHGFALNVDLDLSPFSHIMPCGLTQCHVTSMAEVRQSAVSPSIVAQQMAQEFARIFNIRWMSLPLDVMRQGHLNHHLTSISPLHT